jgi:hypothetical protein
MDFYLVNLVRSGQEEQVEQELREHVFESPRSRFLRVTWEDIYGQISASSTPGTNRTEQDAVLNYFRNKSLGYDRNHKNLQKAFAV